MITAPVVVVAALAVFAVFEAYAFGLLKHKARVPAKKPAR